MPNFRHARLRAPAAVTSTLTAALLGTAMCLGAVWAPASAAPTTSTGPATLHTTARASTASDTPFATTSASTSAATTSASTPSTTETSTTETSTTAPPTTAPPAAGPACSTNASALFPVVCLPTGFDEDVPAPIGTGETITFDAQVVNDGLAADDAQLVITLPDALRIDPDQYDEVLRYDEWWHDDEDGTSLTCTTSVDGATVTCDTGAIEAGANFLVGIDLTAEDDARPGTSGTFVVALQSAPAMDEFPATSVQASVDFTGSAHLQVTLTPAKATVTVGQSLTLTGTIRNLGPDPAPGAAAFGIVSKDASRYPFIITNSQPLPGTLGSSTALTVRVASNRRSTTSTVSASTPSASKALKRAAPKPTASTSSASKAPVGVGVTVADPGSVGFWPVHTIAAGAMATVRVVVQARSVGTTQLAFLAGSQASDPSCDGENASTCDNVGLATLTAVVAATSTQATTTHAAVSATATASTSQAALPNTGFRAASWTWTGFAGIFFGLGLVLVARPRRRHHARHR